MKIYKIEFKLWFYAWAFEIKTSYSIEDLKIAIFIAVPKFIERKYVEKEDFPLFFEWVLAAIGLLDLSHMMEHVDKWLKEFNTFSITEQSLPDTAEELFTEK